MRRSHTVRTALATGAALLGLVQAVRRGAAEPVDTGDPSLQATLLATDRSRLLLVTRHMPAQQFVAGPPDVGNGLAAIVPRVATEGRALGRPGGRAMRGDRTPGDLALVRTKGR